MSDLASNRTAGLPVSRTGFLSHLSQARRVSGTAKVRGIWAFVSGVSLVPPNLELIEKYRNAEWRRQSRAITGATTSLLRQVGQMPQSCGFHGETEGAGHSGHLRQRHLPGSVNMDGSRHVGVPRRV